MPHRLASTAHDKVWGSPETEPWYRNPERRNIGEIWFSASDSVPLLVKLLFTSDNLSVQVHPGDAYARKHHNSRGKTEMWHILRAEPESKIALGLREQVTPERLREAALTGEIMDLLELDSRAAGRHILRSRGHDTRDRRRHRVVRGAAAFGYHIPALRLRAPA